MKAYMQVEFDMGLLTSSAAMLAGAASTAQAEPVAGPWFRMCPECIQGVFVAADGPEAEPK